PPAPAAPAAPAPPAIPAAPPVPPDPPLLLAVSEQPATISPVTISPGTIEQPSNHVLIILRDIYELLVFVYADILERHVSDQPQPQKAAAGHGLPGPRAGRPPVARKDPLEGGGASPPHRREHGGEGVAGDAHIPLRVTRREAEEQPLDRLGVRERLEQGRAM